MNNIIDDSKLNPQGRDDGDKTQADVLLGGDQFRTGEKPPARKPSEPGLPPDGSEIDGSAQITLTFDQLMELLSKTAGEARESRPLPPQPEPEDEWNPSDPSDPGKRVIYQSDDFDSAEPKKKTYASYDEDDIFDDEEVSREAIRNIRQNSREATYTPVSAEDDRFAVSEVEYSASDLPELRQRRVTPAVPPASARNANVPVIAQSGASRAGKYGHVRIEEYEVAEDEPEEDPWDDDEPEEKKKHSAGEIVRRVILVIALIAIAASGAYLVREYILHKQNEEFESEISDLIISVADTTEPTTQKKKKDGKKTTTETTTATTTAPEKTPEQQWAEVRAQYPNVIFPDGMQLKYAKLYATNRDFAGYLEAPGTRLSLPVVRTNEADAENSYLKKNFYGASTKYGCPFVSSLNTPGNEITDFNTVIFGHHMNDRTIFGALDAYKKIDGFKAAPVIHYNTLYKDYTWKVIAVILTNDNPKDDNGYKFEYSFVNLSNDTYKQTYLNELAKRSLYDTGVDVNVNDKLLTLSTCSHEFDDARFVVVARMVRAGESADVDVSRAFVNTSPRYPQAYYDAKKQNNPYIGDNNWYGE